MKNKLIFIGFLCLPLFMMLQFSYALVVREPYPAFMMPGFSKIDNNQTTYVLKDHEINIVFKDQTINTIDLKEIAPPFSKIAISRSVDLAFFNSSSTQNYNSVQKKYYAIIEKVIGSDNYEKYILSVRHPKITIQETALFSNWLLEKIETKFEKEIEELSITKNEYSRDFKSGEILEVNLIGKTDIPND